MLTPCVAGFMSGSQKRTAPVGAGKAGAHQPPGTQPRGALPMIVHPPAIYNMDSSDSSAGQGLPPGPGGAALAPHPIPPHPYPLVNAAAAATDVAAAAPPPPPPPPSGYTQTGQDEDDTMGDGPSIFMAQQNVQNNLFQEQVLQQLNIQVNDPALLEELDRRGARLA